jgi:TrmH family RNA methyltransferase
MLSKSQIKYVTSLRHKKYRDANRVFVAEGEKMVRHLLGLGAKPMSLYCTQEGLFANAETVAQSEMARISNLSSPSVVLAVFAMPQFTITPFAHNFTLVCDGLRDPGNFGTILRLCDWFGVRQVVCTDDCVDNFNEKVVQASMGSVFSVPVVALERHHLLQVAQEKEVALVGTAMKGEDFYHVQLPVKAALVIGNEGQGISQVLWDSCKQFVMIPAAEGAQAESLNAAVSTAILLSAFSRMNSHNG